MVIHLDTMVHASHLIGEPDRPLSASITYISALDMFDIFYVNKYVDHHTYKIAFYILTVVLVTLVHISLISNYGITWY